MKIDQSVVDALKLSIANTQRCYSDIGRLYLDLEQLEERLTTIRRQITSLKSTAMELESKSNLLRDSIVDEYGAGSLDLDSGEYTQDEVE